MKNLLIALYNFDYSEYEAKGWEILDTVKTKDRLTRRILAKTLHNRYDNLLIGSENWHTQMRKFLIKATIFICPSKRKRIIDNSGKEYKITFLNFIGSGILFVADILISLPLYWYLRIKAKHLKTTNPIPLKLSSELNSKTEKPQPSLAYFKTDFLFKLLAGGSVGHTAGVVNAFQKKGFKTTFYIMGEMPCISPKVKTTHIPHNFFFNNLSEMQTNIYNIIFNLRVKKDFKKHKPSLIYQRYSARNFSGVTLSRKYKLPFILEYNGSEVWIAKNWGDPFIHQAFAEDVELANLRHANLIVVVSKPMKEELIERGINPKKILVQPNCINPNEFHPNIDDKEIIRKYRLKGKTVIGFIGTFGAWHGIELLAKTIKQTTSQNPNIHYLLIGDGILKKEVEEIIKQNKVESKVTLTGLIPQKDAPKHLAACDILVSPTLPNSDGSKFFGSPTKLFEYMGMGKAIVASDLDQIGEVLEDKKTALLTKPGNLEDITKKILELATNKELREKLGKAAHKEVVKKYTWEKNVESVLERLKSLEK